MKEYCKLHSFVGSENDSRNCEDCMNENMVEPRPFIPTFFSRIRCEFDEKFEDYLYDDMVNVVSLKENEEEAYVSDIKDFCIQKCKELLEEVRGQIPKGLPYSARLCQNQNGLEYCGTCNQAWEQCSCPARNTGYKQAINKVLEILNSYEK